jgi:hypothetical protein
MAAHTSAPTGIDVFDLSAMGINVDSSTQQADDNVG